MRQTTKRIAGVTNKINQNQTSTVLFVYVNERLLEIAIETDEQAAMAYIYERTQEALR